VGQTNVEMTLDTAGMTAHATSFHGVQRFQTVFVDLDDNSGIAIGYFAHFVFGGGAQDFRKLGRSELVVVS
jgi:hypothetical protein